MNTRDGYSGLSKRLTYPELVDAAVKSLNEIHMLKGLPPDERYLRRHIDGAVRYLVDLKNVRDLQKAFVLQTMDGLEERTLRSSPEYRDFERKSVLALEGIYTFMHRAFWFVRVSGEAQEAKIDIRPSFQTESEAMNWLRDFRFISEYRNKLIEHAHENPSFYSRWGQRYNHEDPYDFRLWILCDDLKELFKNDAEIRQQIKKNLITIGEKQQLAKARFPELPYSFCFDYLDGAQYLSNTQIEQAFVKALKKTGCVSHEPTVLAEKLTNLMSFTFRERIASLSDR